MGTTIGRPTKYTPELADLICERLSTTNRGLQNICDDPDMPGKTAVWRWLSQYPDFREKYVRAREYQTELLYDDLNNVATAPLVDPWGNPMDGGNAMAEVQRRKLVCDNIKFILAKLQPKRFGDNRNMTVDVNVRKQITPEEFLQLRQELAKKNLMPPAEDIDHEEV